jgi:hypothetical protein
LKKIAKAIARLKLKNIVDEKDAEETMEFYNAMLVKFQKHVIVTEPIKTIAYKKGVEIVKRYENFGGIKLEDLFVTMCKENKQLTTYFGYDNGKSLKIQDNRKVSEVKKLLLNNSNIKRVQDNPIVLKWFDDYNNPQPQSDTPDISDKENYTDQQKNDKKNNNFYENGSEAVSGMSDMSDSSFSNNEEESIKGVQFHPKGEIHEISNEQYRELKGGED